MKDKFSDFQACIVEVETLCDDMYDQGYDPAIIIAALLHFVITHSSNDAASWRTLFDDMCNQMEEVERESIH